MCKHSASVTGEQQTQQPLQTAGAPWMHAYLTEKFRAHSAQDKPSSSKQWSQRVAQR